ncbi:hypothetical protein GCM10027299_48380 [Larkinella ripae]
MNRIFAYFFLCFVFLFSSCEDRYLKPKVVTMQVADHQVDCVSVAPQKCLLVRMEGDTSWTYQYTRIEGFTYEAGYEYTLSIKRKRVKNPPADASSIRYILVEILEKKKK